MDEETTDVLDLPVEEHEESKMEPQADSEEEVVTQYVDRIKHVYSHYHITDEELAFAQRTIVNEKIEVIEIKTNEEKDCEVVIHTDQTVYHFYKFRAHYVGHSSKALLDLLDFFDIALPMEFLIEYQNMMLYLNGDRKKIAVGEDDFLIDFRLGKYRLIETVTWEMSTDIVDILMELAHQTEGFDGRPELIIESLVKMEMQAEE